MATRRAGSAGLSLARSPLMEMPVRALRIRNVCLVLVALLLAGRPCRADDVRMLCDFEGAAALLKQIESLRAEETSGGT